MKKGLLVLAFCTVFMILTAPGCSIAKSVDGAESVADKYFAAMKSQDFDSALACYGDKFFQKVDRDSWKESLGVIIKKLGELKSYKLAGWNVNYQAGLQGGGTTYVLSYTVEYDKYSSAEVLTLFQKGSKGDILIVGHNINSEGFLKE